MTIAIEPLAPHLSFGSHIRGLRRSDLADPELCDQLRDLWTERGVLLFSEGEASVDMHLDLARCFGEVRPHPHKELWAEGNPNICFQTTGGADDILYEVDGAPAPTFSPWHIDMIYTPQITHGTMLRMMTPTSIGGLTGFIDQISSYDRLPEATKERIKDLRVIYKLHVELEKNPFATRGREVRLLSASPYFQSMVEREDRDFPPVSHPLVFVQPGTGRQGLRLSPMFAVQIEGMPKHESDPLLAELVDHLTDERHAYFHHWTPDEFVLWDNWRTIHMATASPLGEIRTIQRCVIAGDYAHGRSAQLAA